MGNSPSDQRRRHHHYHGHNNNQQQQPQSPQSPGSSTAAAPRPGGDSEAPPSPVPFPPNAHFVTPDPYQHHHGHQYPYRGPYPYPSYNPQGHTYGPQGGPYRPPPPPYMHPQWPPPPYGGGMPHYGMGGPYNGPPPYGGGPYPPPPTGAMNWRGNSAPYGGHMGGLMPTPQISEPQKTEMIRNDVNLKRSSLKLEPDEENPGQYLLTFTFDAIASGSISVFFCVEEGEGSRLTSLRPDLFAPKRVPFQSGLGQKFRQSPGEGVHLSRFDPADLIQRDRRSERPSLNASSGAASAPTAPSAYYPLVVRTESVGKGAPEGFAGLEEQAPGWKLPPWVQAQTTYAVIEKHVHAGKAGGDGAAKEEIEFTVKVLKQKIWVEGKRYELQEIYGIEQAGASSSGQKQGGGAAGGGNEGDADAGDDDTGKDCVICLSAPKDTTVLPCRHMCMCSECARLLRFQSNRCPICRQVVERLLEIHVPEKRPQPAQTQQPTQPNDGESKGDSTAAVKGVSSGVPPPGGAGGGSGPAPDVPPTGQMGELHIGGGGPSQ